MNKRPPKWGFTLAEVLIALALLGIIAAFTIPKLLQNTGTQLQNSVGHETMGTISSAYQSYLKDHGPPPLSFSARDLLPYLNYMSEDTTTVIDTGYHYRMIGDLSRTCNYNGGSCLTFQNGSKLYINPNVTFQGLDTSDRSKLAIWFTLDTDGKLSSISTLDLYLYYDGKLCTLSGIRPGTYGVDSTGAAQPAWNPTPGYDPEWLVW